MLRIRAGRAGLHQNAGFLEDVRARTEADAAFRVFFIRKACVESGTGLDKHLQFQFDEGFTGAWRQCDAPLAPERFARDTDDKRDGTPP